MRLLSGPAGTRVLDDFFRHIAGPGLGRAEQALEETGHLCLSVAPPHGLLRMVASTWPGFLHGIERCKGMCPEPYYGL